MKLQLCHKIWVDVFKEIGCNTEKRRSLNLVVIEVLVSQACVNIVSGPGNRGQVKGHTVERNVDI